MSRSLQNQLLSAVKHGNFEKVNEYLQNGADISYEYDNDSRSLLHHACENGHLKIVTLLLKNGADKNYKDKIYGNSPLNNAFFHRKFEVVKLLIQYGAQVESKDNHGNTPLMEAAKKGHKEIVELLLQNGADVNSKDRCGSSPLYLAAKGGHLEVVKFLVQNHADIKINAMNNDDRTPLAVAAGYAHIEIVKFLLKKGADINSKDKDGRCPLHFALYEGKQESQTLEVVKLLIQKGADVNSKDREGRICINRAVYKGYTNTLKYFIEEIGVDVESKGEWENTPMIQAAKHGKFEAMQILLQNGAQINAKDENDWTPLHCAASEGHLKIVKVLLQEGAEKDAKNNENKTPFQLAADKLKMIEEGHYHSILGVKKSARDEEVEQAYQKLASEYRNQGKKQYDPDVKEIKKAFDRIRKKREYEDIRECFISKNYNSILPKSSWADEVNGYEARESLIEALSMNDQLLKNRKLRIDISTNAGSGGDRGNRGDRFNNRNDNRYNNRYDDGEDRTQGDWRSGPAPAFRDDDRDRRDGGGYNWRDGGSGGYDRGGGHHCDRRSAERDGDDTPKERPRLQLQKRTAPVEPASASSAIFGGAKPVDTAKKEQEIEEKLQKLQVDVKSRSRTQSECSERRVIDYNQFGQF